MSDLAHGWGQLLHARAGAARVETETAQWVLPAGHALWIPPGHDHVVRCVTRVRFATLYFHPRALPALPDHCDVVSVTPLLRALVLEIVSRAPCSEGDTRDGRMVSVLRDELETAPRSPGALPMPRSAPARRLAELVTGTPAARASLDELALTAGASRRTLERQFQRETGTSLGAWCRAARLHQARIGLAEGRPVAEVAQEAGYATPSAFVHAFRRALGTTPAAWRGRLRS